MKILTSLLILLSLIACDKKNEKNDFLWDKENPSPLAALPHKMDSKPLLISGVRIMTAAGKVYEKADILFEKGLIKKISENSIDAPNGTRTIDGKGLTLTPGVIDVHSHMGVYPSPGVSAHSDGNESSKPVTANVWAEHGFWPQDPDIWRALGGGITTIQVLPGSANLVGGRSFTAKLLPKLSAREMRFDGAPQGLKMACGENPKRVYQNKGLVTRMGNVAGYRKAFQEAVEYMRDVKKSGGTPKKRDFVSETLAKVISGEILLHFHCYRADDISAILDVAKEFGFKIRTVHHGLEAYKIAGRLAKEGVATATWADWWGFKMEAFDGIPQNAALLQKAGAMPIIHSDSATDIRFLTLEAGKAMISGQKLGIPITEDQALQWVTKNPAWAIGLEDKIGTIEEGKMADVALWDGHPFSVYTKTKYVIINGKVVFDRDNKIRPRSDFEVGHNDMAFYDGRDFNPPPLNQTVQSQVYESYEKATELKKANSYAINNVTLFIDGKWQSNSSISFDEGGYITALQAQPVTSKNMQIFDGKGKFLTPGFIEPAGWLGLVEVAMEKTTNDSYSGPQMTPGNYALDAINLNSVRIPIDRHEGITTTISQPVGGLISGHGVAFDLDPKNPSYKKLVALYGHASKFGGKDTKSRSMNWRDIKSLIFATNNYMKDPNSFIKQQGFVSKYSPEDLQAMIPVLKGKVPWVIHVEQKDEILSVLRFREDLLKKNMPVKIVLHGAGESWMVAKQLSKLKIPVIITPSHLTPQSFAKVHTRFDLAAFLDKAGVPVIIHPGEDFMGRRIRQEAGFAVKYGMKPEAALKAITETPGKVFNLNRGILKKGSLANLVLWSGDPLEPTSWVEQIWIGGKSQSLNNRQLELAKKYLNSSMTKEEK